jgi:hypothetical protein
VGSVRDEGGTGRVERKERCEGLFGSSSYSCLKDPPKRKHHLYKKTYIKKWRPPRSPSRPTSPASGKYPLLLLPLSALSAIFSANKKIYYNRRKDTSEKLDPRNRDDSESHVETIINHPRKHHDHKEQDHNTTAEL